MRRQLWYLLGSLVAAVLAAVLAVRIVSSYTDTEMVVVATRELLPYTQVPVDGVRLATLPRAAVPADALREVGQATGRFLRDRVLAGEPLRESRFARVQGDRDLAAQLTALGDPALRAFALTLDPAAGIAGKLRAGDRVDVVATVRIEAVQGSNVSVAKTIARAVPVLQAAGGETGPATVVLALTPAQIEDVAFAMATGQVRLTLNPYAPDTRAADTSGVTGRTWLDKFHVPR